MDYTTLLLFSFVWASIYVFIFCQRSPSPKTTKLPPGPRPLPIIGNILELGSKPHQALTNLSKIYGPVMTLKLGSITTIVISSPDMAEEVLNKNDLVFSGRTIPHTLETQDHHKFSLAFLSPSTQWRILRRACGTNIFSPQKLESTQIFRQRKLQDLLDYVHECCKKGEALDIGQTAFTTVLNSMSNTFFSVDFAGFASDSSQEFKDLIWGIMEESGRPNVADFFPFLRLFDPQRARARMDRYSVKFFAFIDGIIEQRLKSRTSKINSRASSDVLDSFLNLMEKGNSQLSHLDVLHLFADLLIAGIDTTSSTVEWAMAELLSYPEKLKKARKELQQVTSKHVEESHISKLPYLKAVVKETLRLHPPTPFLVPRKSQDDAEIYSFAVPKNAQILVNIWAIGRDPSIWPDSNLFVPERFLESKIDFKGSNFEFIPFGAGRRICPGLPLASTVVPLVLASLLHKHDWKLANELKPNEIDMGEKFGITLRRAHPLQAIPIKA